MKVTRIRAIQLFNSLGQLDRGIDGQPYNLDFEQFELMFVMMRTLKDVVEPWQKAREQRMKVMAGSTPIKRTAIGPEIDDPIKMEKFNSEEQKLIDEVIRIRMPKKKLDLATDKNKYPPGLLIALQGLWNEPSPDKFELEDEDEDEDDEPVPLRAAE